jgi:hypothetical protein
MKQDTYRAILFGAFLLIFLATAAVVILSLVGLVNIEDSYEKALFGALILEVVGCIITLWKQLNSSSSNPPDISGEWEYECTRDDITCKHGGYCSITVNNSTFGWEFSMHAKRTRMEKKKDGDWQKTILEAPYAWDSSWGAFLGDDELRYGYSIQVPEMVIQGYGFLNITSFQDKKPSIIEGNFYQLPPGNPFYGSERYTRINKR